MRITRVEVIDENGRSYVSWEDDNDVSWQFQDDGRTLKVFVNKVEPKTGEEGALEALDKFQNDWLLGKKCPETKLEIKKLDSVESIKAEIKMLQSKLSFYEELEKTKSPVEEAYKDWWGQYPETGNWDSNDDTRWAGFQAGYNAAYEEKVAEEPKEQKWDVVRESVKWCEEHPDESVEDYLTPHTTEKTEKLQEKNWYVDAKTLLKSNWEPKPKTPEETAQSLKEAFVKAQQTEKWKETQRKIDTPRESWMDKPIDELVDKLMENPPECLRFQLGKTLEDIVTRWWCDTFTGPHEKWSMEECIDDLIDQVELWIPRSQSHEGTQNIDTVVAVEVHNELLQKIKSKLRNKKDT